MSTKINMTTEELLKEYEQALQAEAQQNYALELSRIPVKVIQYRLELQIKLGVQTTAKTPEIPQPPTELQLFLKKHAKRLTHEDREFGEQPSHTSAEVADYLVKHRNWPLEAYKDGLIRPGRGDRNGKRMWDTISVLEYVLDLKDDQADQEQKRIL